MFCPMCGAPNDDADQFCGNCGAALTSDVAPSEARAEGIEPADQEMAPAIVEAEKMAEALPEPVALAEEPFEASPAAALAPVEVLEPEPPIPPPPAYSPPPAAAPAPTTSGLAIASFISGIAGLTVLPLLGSVLAIILGYMARSEIRQRPELLTGGGLALAGLIMGWVSVGLSILGLLLAGTLAVCGVCGAFGASGLQF